MIGNVNRGPDYPAAASKLLQCLLVELDVSGEVWSSCWTEDVPGINRMPGASSNEWLR
jgi:hypothetical protein